MLRPQNSPTRELVNLDGAWRFAVDRDRRGLAEPGGGYSPDTLPSLAAEYGAEIDFEATMPLVERHGLAF